MSDKEYSGDKSGRVRMPRTLVEQIVALNRALSDWADAGCDVTGGCDHANGDCPWHWLEGVISKHPGVFGIAPLRLSLDIKSSWIDDAGNERWGLQSVEGAIDSNEFYLPDYYWTSVHPEAPQELHDAEMADLVPARLERVL